MAAILARSVFRVLADRARDTGVEGTRGGTVVVIQRFGGALNLNVHFHALVLDGVFASGDAADPEFHPTRRLTALDVAEVLAAIEALVARRLRRMGYAGSTETGEATAELFGDRSSGLAALTAAAAEGMVAFGPRPGRRVTRTGVSRAPTDVATGGPCHAVSYGYSLRADLVVPRGRDGTTGFVFDPVDFLGRLAVLVPRPRVNLILYYGMLGARSAWRPGAPTVRPTAPDAGRPAGAVVYEAAEADRACAATAANRARARQWAALMQRTFGFDVLECPRCAGRLRLVAVIEASGVVRRILMHLGLPAEVPVPRPARAPPLLDEVHDVRDWHEQPGSGFDT